MKPRLALYPGSFDPITNGHLDILERALRVFDRVAIVVASNAKKDAAAGSPGSPGSKGTLLTSAERVLLIQSAIRERELSARVEVVEWGGLIMELARERGACAVVRGLRAASDFEYEFMMASMNSQLNPDVESVFMMTSQHHHFVSSSLIKEVFGYGGDIAPYVPGVVLDFLKARAPAPAKASKAKGSAT